MIWLALAHQQDQIVIKYIGVDYPHLSDDVLFLVQTHPDLSDNVPFSILPCTK